MMCPTSDFVHRNKTVSPLTYWRRNQKLPWNYESSQLSNVSKIFADTLEYSQDNLQFWVEQENVYTFSLY